MRQLLTCIVRGLAPDKDRIGAALQLLKVSPNTAATAIVLHITATAVHTNCWCRQALLLRECLSWLRQLQLRLRCLVLRLLGLRFCCSCGRCSVDLGSVLGKLL